MTGDWSDGVNDDNESFLLGVSPDFWFECPDE
jgi:hypothetical protein